MKEKLLNEAPERTFAVVFDKGDEVLESLTGFAKKHGLKAARLTGLGAFSSLVLGFFEREQKDYKKIFLEEQVEVLSLIGDIALSKGEPKLHLHVVVGKADGTAHGGHLLKAEVWPTLEVMVVESPGYLCRKYE
jgi:uncharacterized protein